MNAKNKALDNAKGGKESYLNKERKHNADFMRKKGYGDVLAMRKSIGRKTRD